MILTLNAGSSSLRFAVFHVLGKRLQRGLTGKIDRIGLPGSSLTVKGTRAIPLGSRPAVRFFLDWIAQQVDFSRIQGIGHRVVFGMARSGHEPVTPRLLRDLRRWTPFDPEHLPREIELMNAFRKRYPKVPQLACFDTVFHHAMPRMAQLLAIPRRFQQAGIRRYGYHGLSYAYLMQELSRQAGVRTARGRVILAHLGNGASLAAVRGGRCLDTSMGLTPTSGIPMGTRPGDLDPGLAEYLLHAQRLSVREFGRLIHHQSGLLGLSGTTSDMQDLQKRQARDPRARDAVEYFCYQTRKWIGAYAAVLNGLDTLVFSGGIGENSPALRARMCGELGYLGIQIDPRRNRRNSAIISKAASRVTVRVIQTDEEIYIAQRLQEAFL